VVSKRTILRYLVGTRLSEWGWVFLKKHATRNT
jgi:hypothetical protein